MMTSIVKKTAKGDIIISKESLPSKKFLPKIQVTVSPSKNSSTSNSSTSKQVTTTTATKLPTGGLSKCQTNKPNNSKLPLLIPISKSPPSTSHERPRSERTVRPSITTKTETTILDAGDDLLVNELTHSMLQAAEMDRGIENAEISKNNEAEEAAQIELQRTISINKERSRKVAEEQELKRQLGNGLVTLIYEQYNEEFAIVDGSTTHANIDDVYCLSFVMPNCLIHLSIHNSQEKRKLETLKGNSMHEEGEDLFIHENPRGKYLGLERGKTYYVYIEQEAEQLARDQARMREVARGMEGINKGDTRSMESCSCLFGNPCVDEYGCKDWSNRCAVASKNGWKGF